MLYLDSEEQADLITARIAQPPVSPANPYWQKNARAFADADGFQILLTVSRSTVTR